MWQIFSLAIFHLHLQIYLFMLSLRLHQILFYDGCKKVIFFFFFSLKVVIFLFCLFRSFKKREYEGKLWVNFAETNLYNNNFKLRVESSARFQPRSQYILS